MSNKDSIQAHVIRLHGPWEGSKGGIRNSEFGTGAPESERPDRVKVPLDLGDWLDADYRGTVTLERAFGLPTNLDGQQSVELVLHTDRLTIDSISLNGATLKSTVVSEACSTAKPDSLASDQPARSGSSTVYRCDVGSQLQSRNRLRVAISIDSVPAGRLTEVALKIHG